MQIKINKQKYVVGIDFGTTESLIQGQDFFYRKTSELFFHHDGTISTEKKSYLFSIKSIKRLLTNKNPQLQYKDQYTIVFGKKNYSVVYLISLILNKLIESLITKYDILAVMTIPAKFNYLLRNKIIEAAELVNIKIIRIIAEPTAAAYLFSQQSKKHGKFLIYDLGGGTFDLSLVKINNLMLRVLQTDGDDNLGGDDLDAFISQKYNISIKKAKQLKENNNIQNLDEYTYNIFKNTILKTQKHSNEIPLILVGGGSILMQNHFNKRPNVIKSLPFQSAVAQGAFLYAQNLLTHNQFLLIDVLPISIGLEVFGDVIDKIFYRNTPLPVSAEREFSNQFSGQKNIKFNIFQGEGEKKDCIKLGSIELNNLPPKPAMSLMIKTIFHININGILTFEATSEGKKCIISIDLYKGLNDKEIALLIKT